jgi:hypothetical protein
MSRHNDYYGTGGGDGDASGGRNPWGNRSGGGGWQRGLARMHARYGIRGPGG